MNDPAAELTSALTQLRPQALVWLEKMVGINSFTTNREGINELGRLTAEAFADLGFTAAQSPSGVTEHGSHLFLYRHRPGAPRLLLVTHLDTVFPPEEEKRNHFHWLPSPSEGRIYGPGTIDIKGGTVLIWMMLHALKQCAPEVFENTDWLIAANSAEEVMSQDFAQQTTERCPDGAAAVLVFEGGPVIDGRHHIVVARKGRAEYRVTARGRGAHAGSAFQEGVNAVTALAPLMTEAAAMSHAARELTVNVARVEGGTVLNRVPHEAFFELEMRAYDPRHLREAGGALRRFAAQGSPGGASIEVTCLGESPGWPADARNLALAQHWHHAAAKLGLDVLPTQRGGLSDANYLCHLGPTLDGLGPSGANAHCSERSADGGKVPEYLEPASLVSKATLNALAILDFLKSHSEER